MPITETILLVEDDENDVLFLKLAMEEAGVANPLQLAANGRQALEYLNGEGKYADRHAYPLPCLVLLDLKLPYVPGLEVLKRMRQHPALREIVVIVLTSSQEVSDVDEAYRLGTNAYVLKPPNLDDLQILARAIRDFWLAFNVPPRIRATEMSAR
jgi:CheY-like chemotaxis protein